MKTIEYATKDKTTWGDGPWQSEPDKRQWVDENTGLPCMVRRGGQGAWCGYVGVSEGHPLFEKGHYDDYNAIVVHGGVTFMDHCSNEDEPARAICHIVEPGENDNVWWIGFDCNHGGDIAPETEHLYKTLNLPCTPSFDVCATYKTIEYVTKETLGLAQQLKALAA